MQHQATCMAFPTWNPLSVQCAFCCGQQQLCFAGLFSRKDSEFIQFRMHVGYMHHSVHAPVHFASKPLVASFRGAPARLRIDFSPNCHILEVLLSTLTKLSAIW